MPTGSKRTYTKKQKDQAAAIEASYEERGLPKAEAEARAWATVNKQSGGGEKSGSGVTTPKAQKDRARKDSAARAAASRQGHERHSEASLATQSKQSLLKEARARDIPGRSTMRKQELIEALKGAS